MRQRCCKDPPTPGSPAPTGSSCRDLVQPAGNADRVPGDVIEAGVWREVSDPHARRLQNLLAVSQAEVRRNFELYDLLDDQVVFVEGWFRDTLPRFPIAGGR